MEAKTLFPKFWLRAKEQGWPDPVSTKEIVVNKPVTPSVDSGSAQRGEMLSYEDIYHAAGIINPASGYSIHKVVEMLNSERIRDLSKDVKRASVLMALDAAGTSVDEILRDATRRQEVLDSYESAKKKQLDDFEAAKSKENSQIEEELERIRSRYAERMQRNQDLVAQEKEALRNWQMAGQHEIQRIAEVAELCGKEPVPAVASDPLQSGDASPETARKPVEKTRLQARAAAGRVC